jgi:hypothetical protein
VNKGKTHISLHHTKKNCLVFKNKQVIEHYSRMQTQLPIAEQESRWMRLFKRSCWCWKLSMSKICVLIIVF